MLPLAALADGPTAGYKKGFYIQSADENYKLKIGGRVQARYHYEAVEGFGSGAEDESAFTIPRARLTLSGNVFNQNLKYKFQTDFAKGFVGLKDFFADYRLVKGWLHLRAGQWKRPFSRQQINSSSRLELVDRAVTNKAFGAGRDIGFALHNNYEKSPGFEWALGVFNATGDKGSFSGKVDTNTGAVTGKFSNIPDFFGPALVARVGYNHGGIKGYSEGDFAGGGFRFAVAASTVVEFDADEDDDSNIRAELDLVAKVSGFATTAAVYMSTAQDGDGFADQSYAAMGAHLQASYMINKTIQPVVRYATLMPEGDDNDIHEIVAGVSAYFWGHKIKWQTDFTMLLSEQESDGAGSGVRASDGTPRRGHMRKDYLVRTQVQLAF